MNCTEFETIVIDLVRGEVADSIVGTGCWAHAANCPRCAERLLEQEKLTAGLAALATQTEKIQTPERIEGVLRREFRHQLAGSEKHPANRPLTARVSPRVVMFKTRLAWAVAAAVLLAPLVGFLATKFRTTSPATSVARVQPAQQPTQPHPSPGEENASKPSVSQGHSKPQGTRTTLVSKPRQLVVGNTDSKMPSRPTNRLSTSDELATNFYPLPYGSGLSLDEGWEIVRVSLPRSELASLGMMLVTNEQTSAETVKADIVLGEDGMARAIRFVQ